MSENDLTEAELLELGAATLGESGGAAMRARIRAAWPGARLAAPAFPVQCTPGDNLAIHVAVAEAPSGFALVVDVGDEPELGYWGEVLTTGAQARGSGRPRHRRWSARRRARSPRTSSPCSRR